MQPVIPWYVTPIVLGMVIALALWLYRLVVRAVESAELAQGTGARVRRGTALFLGGWLMLAFLLSRSTPAVDAIGRGVVPVSFPLFALVSLALAIGLLALSPTWRKVVDAIPADALISVQVYRLIGVIFLPLYAIGSLPRHFALPAGWGDITVGSAGAVSRACHTTSGPRRPAARPGMEPSSASPISPWPSGSAPATCCWRCSPGSAPLPARRR